MSSLIFFCNNAAEYSSDECETSSIDDYNSSDSDKSNGDEDIHISSVITTPKFEVASSVRSKSFFSFDVNEEKDGSRKQFTVYEYNTSSEVEIPLEGLFMKQDVITNVYLTKVFGVSERLSAFIFIGKLWDYPEIVMKMSGLRLFSQLFSNEAKFKIKVTAEIRGWGETVMQWKTKRLPVSTNGTCQTQLRIENCYLNKIKEKFPALPSLIVTIEAYWVFNPTSSLRLYFLTLSRNLLSDEIRQLEGTVIVITSDGKRLKFPRGVLAASSPIFKRQFQNTINIKTEDDNYDYKGSMEIEILGGTETNLNCASVKALLDFLTCFSVREAIKNSDLATDLLMTGHFYEMHELELAMRKILMAQPNEWFSTESLVHMYWYAGQIKDSINKQENFEEWRPWEMLQIKALWNLKRMSRSELEECKTVKKLFPTKASFSTFIHFISHI